MPRRRIFNSAIPLDTDRGFARLFFCKERQMQARRIYICLKFWGLSLGQKNRHVTVKDEIEGFWRKPVYRLLLKGAAEQNQRKMATLENSRRWFFLLLFNFYFPTRKLQDL